MYTIATPGSATLGDKSFSGYADESSEKTTFDEYRSQTICPEPAMLSPSVADICCRLTWSSSYLEGWDREQFTTGVSLQV